MKIELNNVSYIYGAETINKITALDDISLSIGEREFIGLIGSTGSGKSTLVQHLNGLIKPTHGNITFDGHTINENDFDLKALRCKVGLVFQYPEHQLFEENILADVCFGPLNQGCTKQEAINRACEALEQVGIKEEIYDKSPFEISGGQKRRVAIAGVLAMNPEVLILDEPAAGLDPRGKDRILKLISKLHTERGITVILVSHSMEDVARYADRLIVMNNGRIAYDDFPKKVFEHYEELEKIGLLAPQVTYVLNALKEKGLDIDTTAITIEQAKKSIIDAITKRNR
ncbi:MAG: energy-coupling factor transporter ATPase [Eubacterium sp.]